MRENRSQLRVGESGAAILGDVRGESRAPRAGDETHRVLVRVDDVRAHCERARAEGARILREPVDFEYGERRYEAEDPFGHRWTFSQLVAGRRRAGAPIRSRHLLVTDTCGFRR